MRAIVLSVLVIGLCGSAQSQTPPAPAESPAPTPPPVPAEVKALNGFWKPESIKFDGAEQLPNATAKSLMTLVIKDGEYRMYYNTAPGKDEHIRIFTADMKLDPATKTFELAVRDGQKKGLRMHGVYEASGSNLKICYGPADKPRPTAFDAPKNSGYFLELWNVEKRITSLPAKPAQ
ncbi:TIGR03067 domain-containing protein [Fimbriiglobus ruber]|uniref:TIGR03067 domain-containing protein n=1 Tax=Fimbriiglobus ruber TaxID=1908690 RepID=A0A225DFJ9_9BACT|nr:TIGR03067 domain-containing protein [Fimbriiglobus ruber]OWK40262.1 hypothetical protein FRUB_05181 [Fimbriiglobus ruber]